MCTVPGSGPLGLLALPLQLRVLIGAGKGCDYDSIHVYWPRPLLGRVLELKRGIIMAPPTFCVMWLNNYACYYALVYDIL